MKVSSLLFLGFLGTVSAVAAEDDLLSEYSDTEYGEEYAVDTKYGGYGEFAYDTVPNYGELESYADEELEPKTDSGWFMPDVNGRFYWMSKEQLNKEREAIEEQICNYGGSDLTNYFLYSHNESITYVSLRYGDKDALENSQFNYRLSIMFLIVGWDMNCRSDFIDEATKVLFAEKYDNVHNIFCVDWSSYTANPYYSVRDRVEEVGKYVARFIDFLYLEKGITFFNSTLVGYGLGAHVAGHAGKNVKNGKIHIIIGLDPASLGFDYDNCTERMCSTDATYVQSIQTNGGDFFPMGFDKPLGKQTFYPDGGIYQNPCMGNGGFGCSHYMAWKYYVSALKNDVFCSIQCENYTDAQNKACGNGSSGTNMFFPMKYKYPGIYYVPIEREYPYGACSRCENSK